jgi:hypothetical protein
VDDQGSLFPIVRRRQRGRFRRGFDDHLKASRDLGRLEPVDADLIVLCRVLADQVDAACADPDESRYTVGTLAKCYLTVRTALTGQAGESNDADDLAGILAAVRHQRTGE